MRSTSKGLLTAIGLLVAATTCQPQTPESSAQTNPNNSRPAKSIIYTSRQYGFKFRLPAGWKGYSIITTEWSGESVDEPTSDEAPQPPKPRDMESGPTITIRHPLWTKANPWQDIPIMVFTLAQWHLVDTDKLSVSAAPFGPQEIGRNAKYVFALPPRYNYGDAVGIEEVNDIVQSHPLHAF